MPSLVSRGRGRRTINEINMVPFIDVMLVLLIIFMVTAPLITPSLINLPSVGKASQQPDQILQIVIGQDNALEFKVRDKTTRLTLKDIANAVKQAQSADAKAGVPPVVISADKSISYESVVRLMDTLQRAGVQRIGLSVQVSP
jgi:biopolymer transport protein TolR